MPSVWGDGDTVHCSESLLKWPSVTWCFIIHGKVKNVRSRTPKLSAFWNVWIGIAKQSLEAHKFPQATVAIWFAPWHILFYCHWFTKSCEIYLAKRMDRKHETFEKQNNWELAVEHWLFLKYFYAWRSSLNSCSIIGAKRRGIDAEIVVAVPLKSSDIFFFLMHSCWTKACWMNKYNRPVS